MNRPILTVPERKLGYKFAAAEAAWILSGDNRVSTISPFARHIQVFTDDGQFYAGAYGPKVIDQLSYVCETLAKDPASRQAVMTIWRENPRPSKDIPCTIAIQWVIRNGRLCCIDTMRSSDAWLGWPYDVSNFSMLGGYIHLMLKKCYGLDVPLGILILTAGSAHLYEPQWEPARDILRQYSAKGYTGQSSPDIFPAIEEMKEPQDLVEELWSAAKFKGLLEKFN